MITDQLELENQVYLSNKGQWNAGNEVRDITPPLFVTTPSSTSSSSLQPNTLSKTDDRTYTWNSVSSLEGGVSGSVSHVALPHPIVQNIETDGELSKSYDLDLLNVSNQHGRHSSSTQSTSNTSIADLPTGVGSILFPTSMSRRDRYLVIQLKSGQLPREQRRRLIKYRLEECRSLADFTPADLIFLDQFSSSDDESQTNKGVSIAADIVTSKPKSTNTDILLTGNCSDTTSGIDRYDEGRVLRAVNLEIDSGKEKVESPILYNQNTTESIEIKPYTAEEIKKDCVYSELRNLQRDTEGTAEFHIEIDSLDTGGRREENTPKTSETVYNDKIQSSKGIYTN